MEKSNVPINNGIILLIENCSNGEWKIENDIKKRSNEKSKI
jgi:hypothetical protein